MTAALDRFDSLLALQRTRSRLRSLEVLPLASDLVHTRSGGRMPIELRAVSGEVEDLGQFRAFAADGQKISILSVFLYPRPELAMPSYAMEIVVISGRPVVAVMDLPSCCGGRGEQIGLAEMLKLHEVLPGHVPGVDPPDWFDSCRSGYDLFERPSVEALPRLVESHLHLVGRWQERARRAVRLLGPAVVAHAEAQQAYRDHHRRHTPGLTFLQRCKGEEWTERLLQVVFGPAHDLVC